MEVSADSCELRSEASDDALEGSGGAALGEGNGRSEGDCGGGEEEGEETHGACWWVGVVRKVVRLWWIDE